MSLEGASVSILNAARPAKLSSYAGTDEVYATFSVLVFAMIFLQKLGVNFGDRSVGLNAALLWLGFGILFRNRRLAAPSARLILFLCLLFAMSIGAIGEAPSAFTGAAIFVAYYVLFNFQITVTVDTASRCLLAYQKGMLVIAIIVIVQQ